MVNIVNKIPTIIFIFLFMSSSVTAAEITARVDRNIIPVGESFQLYLTAKGSVDKEPDFSELQKTFTILNTSQSTRYSNINGVSSKDKTWVLVLIVDKPGKYTIPAINFGKDKSKGFTITIGGNTNTKGAKQPATIFLKVDVEPKSVYVQQQLIYTIKIYWQGRISNASLTELVSENDQAIITRFGKDSESTTTINGINYTVLERRFAIFPQKSGIIKLAPLTFKTQFINPNVRQRSYFNLSPFGAQSAVKRIRSKAFEIKVKGIPAEFTKKYPNASWLPVAQLSILESWSGDIKTLKSGEPMTRTINLMAQNLTAAQLPDIKMLTPKNIKSYPDVPVVKQKNNAIGITAVKQFKTAILPTKLGKFTLSKIVIPWWNTKTNSIQTSTLAAQTITVNAAANQDEDQSSNIISQDSDAVSDENIIKNNSSLNSSEPKNAENLFDNLWFIICVIFVLLWLVMVYLYLRLRAKLNIPSSELIESKVTTRVPSKLIKNACQSNNAQQCCKILLQWANSKSESEQFTNLASLYPYTETKLRYALEELEYYLYSNKPQDWQGGRLWVLFKQQPPTISATSTSTSGHSTLASLYAKYE